MKIQDFFAKHKNQILNDPQIANVNILRDFVDAKNTEKNATFATYGIIISFLFMVIDLIIIFIWGYHESTLIIFILTVLMLFMFLGGLIRDVITIRRFVKKSYQLDEAIRSQIQRKWRRSIRLGVIAVLILLLRLNKIPSTGRGIDSHDSLFEVNMPPSAVKEPVDVESEQPMGDEAEYFAVDGQRHIVINARFGFSITLPNTWRAFSRSVNGDGYFITCENPNIDMRVYGINEAIPIEENDKMKPFVFDSGITGWYEEVHGESLMFSYRSDEKIICLYVKYAGEETWFNEHKETVMTAAKSLRDEI